MIKEIALARKISANLQPSRKWVPMRQTGEECLDGAEVWVNDRYTATLRKHPDGWILDAKMPWAQIGIYCEDGLPRHDWREFQAIKNDLVGSEWEALELYPAESRVLDPSNYFMLTAAPILPFGQREGRRVMTPETSIAPQRGWIKPPNDIKSK